MENSKRTKLIVVAAAIFVLVAVFFMFGGKLPSISLSSGIRKTDSTEMPAATGGSDTIDRKVTIEQSFVCTSDTITQIGIVFYKNEQIENVNVVVELLDGNKTLMQGIYPAENIESEHRTFLVANETLSGLKNKKLTLKFYSFDGQDTGLGLMVCESMNCSYKYNGSSRKGSICFAIEE